MKSQNSKILNIFKILDYLECIFIISMLYKSLIIQKKTYYRSLSNNKIEDNLLYQDQDETQLLIDMRKSIKFICVSLTITMISYTIFTPILISNNIC